MHSVIAQECKKWSRHINKEFVKKLNFKRLDKEFKANEWSNNTNSGRKNKAVFL